MAQLRHHLRICDDLHLALVHDRVKIILDLRVQHLADVFRAESRLIGRVTDTDADHVALSGMHHALDAVDIAVELTLEHGLEIGLHVLSRYFHDVAQAVLASKLEAVEVRSDQLDLVVLHLGRLFGLHQLEAVHSGSVELDLHLLAADDLAFKRGRERHRDIDLGDLDLDITGLQGGGVEPGDVFLHDQALRHPEDVLGLVGDDREAKGDRAGSAGNHHII